MMAISRVRSALRDPPSSFCRWWVSQARPTLHSSYRYGGGPGGTAEPVFSRRGTDSRATGWSNCGSVVAVLPPVQGGAEASRDSLPGVMPAAALSSAEGVEVCQLPAVSGPPVGRSTQAGGETSIVRSAWSFSPRPWCNARIIADANWWADRSAREAQSAGHAPEASCGSAPHSERSTGRTGLALASRDRAARPIHRPELPRLCPRHRAAEGHQDAFVSRG